MEEARAHAPQPPDEMHMADTILGPTDSPLHAAAPADVEGVVLGLAAQEATGCLVIGDGAGGEGLVWFRDGQVYAVSVPGRRPLLGVRLVTAGAISPDQLNAALEMQRSQMTSARLGEVLVHLRMVNRRVVEAFVLEQQRDMLADLLAWPVHTTHFRNGARTRTDLSPFVDVADLIAQARTRQYHWTQMLAELGGPDIVPIPTDFAPLAALAPSETVVLRLVDGVRTLTDIADDCGYTLFEAGDVVRGLIAAGLATTATDLLHDPRPSIPLSVSEPVATPDEPSSFDNVLPLHPHEAVDEMDVIDQASITAPAFDEPAMAFQEPALSFEPAVTAEATATPYDELPPPSTSPVGYEAPSLLDDSVLNPHVDLGNDPLDTSVPLTPTEPPSPTAPTEPVEPTDTAALMRELTSLGMSDPPE